MVKKQTRNIEVKITDLGGHEFTATDSAEIQAGHLALGLFQHHDTVEIKEEEKTTYIPFHAICHVEVTTTTSEEEVDDDTCKDVDWCCKEETPQP